MESNKDNDKDVKLWPCRKCKGTGKYPNRTRTCIYCMGTGSANDIIL